MTGEPRRLYFDHNASAPLLPEARAAMLDVLTAPGNPSSVHAEGRQARAAVEDARRALAALVAASADGVVFTGGASEAANAALSPLWQRGGADLPLHAMAAIETDHLCLTFGGRFAPDQVTLLPIDRHGRLSLEALSAWVEAEAGTPRLLALTLANNESGVIQPVAEVRRVIEGRDILLVVDAVQAVGRLRVDIGALGADAVILSGHKIGATQGVGALVLRDPGFAPAPLIRGGSQERRHRAGTPATPAIASFGAAAAIAAARTATDWRRLETLRERLIATLRDHGDIVVFGEAGERLANTVFIAAPGVAAETAQIGLDLQGFAVSAGSACASGKVAGSPVVAAHARAGLPVDPRMGALRLSFGFDTTDAEIDAMGAALGAMLERAQIHSRASAAA